MMERKVLVWRCPDCGKEIVSLYPRQLDALSRSHTMFCRGRRGTRR